MILTIRNSQHVVFFLISNSPYHLEKKYVKSKNFKNHSEKIFEKFLKIKFKFGYRVNFQVV